MRNRTFASVLVVAVAAALGAIGPVPALAQAPGAACKPVYDAMLNALSTPNHLVIVTNGKVEGEEITIGNTMYVKVGGQWMKSPMTTQDVIAQEQENIKNITSESCTKMPDETVNGAAAVVYQTQHERKEAGATQAKIWISESTGLPLRTDVGQQGGQKADVSMRFDYDNVKAPIVK